MHRCSWCEAHDANKQKFFTAGTVENFLLWCRRVLNCCPHQRQDGWLQQALPWAALHVWVQVWAQLMRATGIHISSGMFHVKCNLSPKVLPKP